MPRILLLLCVQLFLLVYYQNAPTTLDETSIFILLALALLAIFVLVLRRDKEVSLRGQYLKHSTLVIFGYSVVHFQYFIDFLAGYVPAFHSYIWVNTEIVVKALTVSVSGLVCFVIGYLARSRKNIPEFKYKERIRNNIGSVAVLIYTASLLLLAYFYFANPLYLMGYYGIEQVGDTAAYIILLFKAMIFAILIQNARNFVGEEKRFTNFLDFVRAHGIHFNMLMAIFLLSVVISGDRGPLITFAIVYYGSFLFVSKVKLSIVKTVGLLAAGALLITILGKVRSQDRSLSFGERLESSLEMESRFKTQSVLEQTQELATSVRALHHTMNHVPQKHDYLYGRFQLQQASSIIPFGSSMIASIFDSNHFKYGASSRFVTWLNQGDNPYSGDGSSVTTDFYFDFGLAGVIIGMFIFGYYMRAAELTMYVSQMPSLFSHAFFIGYLGSAIYISRSTFLIEMKAVVWVFAILLINKYLINRR